MLCNAEYIKLLKFTAYLANKFSETSIHANLIFNSPIQGIKYIYTD